MLWMPFDSILHLHLLPLLPIPLQLFRRNHLQKIVYFRQTSSHCLHWPRPWMLWMPFDSILHLLPLRWQQPQRQASLCWSDVYDVSFPHLILLLHHHHHLLLLLHPLFPLFHLLPVLLPSMAIRWMMTQ